MAKTLGKATKIMQLTRYIGDVAVYELSKYLTVGKEKYKHVVVSQAQTVSGGDLVNVWPSDEKGLFTQLKPLKSNKNSNIAATLLELGYKLN